MKRASQMNLVLERVTERREKNNLSKIDTSKLMGISQAAFVRYENGTREPSYHVLKEMAKVFNTSVDYLIGATDDPSPDTYEVSREDNKELYHLVEVCKSLEESQVNRICSYAEKIIKENN